MIEEIVLIQVEGSGQEQLAVEKEGKQMRYQELAQYIEELIEVIDMEMEEETQS